MDKMMQQLERQRFYTCLGNYYLAISQITDEIEARLWRYACNSESFRQRIEFVCSGMENIDMTKAVTELMKDVDHITDEAIIIVEHFTTLVNKYNNGRLELL